MAEETRLTDEERADEASEAYLERFGELPPIPVGVELSFYTETLWKHIAKGEELSDDFDFYPELPEDARA